MTIKGFLGTLVGVVIGGVAIKQVGGISAFPSGLKSATQVGIGLGVLGNTVKNVKGNIKGFRFK